MISVILWRKAETIGKHLNKKGFLEKKILVLDGDGEIRGASYEKGAFYCDSEGEAWIYSSMEPQPKYFAFKPKPIKLWWNK